MKRNTRGRSGRGERGKGVMDIDLGGIKFENAKLKREIAILSKKPHTIPLEFITHSRILEKVTTDNISPTVLFTTYIESKKDDIIFRLTQHLDSSFVLTLGEAEDVYALLRQFCTFVHSNFTYAVTSVVSDMLLTFPDASTRELLDKPQFIPLLLKELGFNLIVFEKLFQMNLINNKTNGGVHDANYFKSIVKGGPIIPPKINIDLSFGVADCFELPVEMLLQIFSWFTIDELENIPMYASRRWCSMILSVQQYYKNYGLYTDELMPKRLNNYARTRLLLDFARDYNVDIEVMSPNYSCFTLMDYDNTTIHENIYTFIKDLGGYNIIDPRKSKVFGWEENFITPKHLKTIKHLGI